MSFAVASYLTVIRRQPHLGHLSRSAKRRAGEGGLTALNAPQASPAGNLGLTVGAERVIKTGLWPLTFALLIRVADSESNRCGGASAERERRVRESWFVAAHAASPLSLSVSEALAIPTFRGGLTIPSSFASVILIQGRYLQPRSNVCGAKL